MNCKDISCAEAFSIALGVARRLAKDGTTVDFREHGLSASQDVVKISCEQRASQWKAEARQAVQLQMDRVAHTWNPRGESWSPFHSRACGSRSPSIPWGRG